MQKIIYVLSIAGILFLLNLLSDQYALRFDLTKDKQYTLSDATKNILQNLEEPVNVSTYFTEDLPTEYSKAQQDFKDLLIEYASISDGNLVFENIVPDMADENKQKLQQEGIPLLSLQIREKDKMEQKEVFLGASVQLGEQKEVIPAIQPNMPMEYTLSLLIKKLALIEKPAIGLIQGHGEPSVAQMAQVNNSLSIQYSFQDLNLDGSIPDEYKTLALVAPKDSFPQNHFQILDEFLARGGNLLVAMNQVDGNLQAQPPMGSQIESNLNSWLAQKGIQVNNDFVIDNQCASIGVQQPVQDPIFGQVMMQRQIAFPYLPVINNFADHPITKGLEQVILQFASSLTYTGDSSLNFSPLLFSSTKSGSLPPPVVFDVQKQWSDLDYLESDLVLGGVLSGNIIGNTPSKLIVLGDGDFAVNGNGNQRQNDNNINLMVNAIDWLSDDTGLIELRTRGAVSRPIDQLEDSKRTFLKYLNFLLPLILVAIYGVFRMQSQQRKRHRRMQEQYV